MSTPEHIHTQQARAASKLLADFTKQYEYMEASTADDAQFVSMAITQAAELTFQLTQLLHSTTQYCVHDRPLTTYCEDCEEAAHPANWPTETPLV